MNEWLWVHCTLFACCRGRMCMPSARGVQMHLPPREATRQRWGLLPDYFGHLLLFWPTSNWSWENYIWLQRRLIRWPLVFWKESAFRLWSAMDRRWNTNVVSVVSFGSIWWRCACRSFVSAEWWYRAMYQLSARQNTIRYDTIRYNTVD